MVGHDTHGDIILFVVAVCFSSHLLNVADDGPKEVGIVVTLYPLDDSGDALKAHAGIDRWFWQRREGAAGIALILHKDQIP